MYFTTGKSDILQCLPLDQDDYPHFPKQFDCVDGAAIVHMLPPNSGQKDFSEYATKRKYPLSGGYSHQL